MRHNFIAFVGFFVLFTAWPESSNVAVGQVVESRIKTVTLGIEGMT